MSIPAAISGKSDPLLASLSSSIPFPASSPAAPHDDQPTGGHIATPASRKDSTSTAGFAESTYEDARSVTTGGSLYSAQMGSQSTITREVEPIRQEEATASGAYAGEEDTVAVEQNVSIQDEDTTTHELCKDAPNVVHASTSRSGSSSNEKGCPSDEKDEEDFTIGRTTGMGLSEKGGMGEKGETDEDTVAMDDPELAALTASQRKIIEEQM